MLCDFWDQVVKGDTSFTLLMRTFILLVLSSHLKKSNYRKVPRCEQAKLYVHAAGDNKAELPANSWLQLSPDMRMSFLGHLAPLSLHMTNIVLGHIWQWLQGWLQVGSAELSIPENYCQTKSRAKGNECMFYMDLLFSKRNRFCYLDMGVTRISEPQSGSQWRPKGGWMEWYWG